MSSQKIKNLYVKPDLDQKSVEISFINSFYTHCRLQVTAPDGTESTFSHLLIPESDNSIEIQLDTVLPWSPGNPDLYSLNMQLTGSEQKHEISQRFGFCKLECRDKWFYLNNDKFYPRAYIRGREAHDHPNLLQLPPEEFYAKNIKAAKSYGFNMVRFHSRVPDDVFLKIADELGIFVHVELRKYYGKYQKQRQGMNDEGEIIDREQWVSTVSRLRNHPCVFAYCMGNEIRHPGHNPYVEEIARLTRKMDSAKLFIDTCAHGEFDRTYVDFDVQHMSYYYPFGSNYDMFDHTYNWTIYGSCKGQELEKHSDRCTVTRALTVRRPVLAHELCHYVALHDIDSLKEKFSSCCPSEEPWWVDELIKLRREKKLEKDYAWRVRASRNFQEMSWKLGIEAARRSNLLGGFHFLQLADTERYENSNGLLDCFDDPKGFSCREFLRFNGDSVILADLPQRAFFAGETVQIPIKLSHFDTRLGPTADLKLKINDAAGNILISSSLEKLDISETGLIDLCKVSVAMPECRNAEQLSISISIDSNGRTTENSWPLWLYPDKPEEIAEMEFVNELRDIDITSRYRQLKASGQARLMIAQRFNEKVFNHLEKGGDVLMLYRIPETRARIAKDYPEEEYYLPATWDRFKGVIWDRGTNCGGLVRPHAALDHFPSEDHINLQYHDLIDDCDKICLDDFPLELDPIIEGIDKAVRDRFDVYTYNLSELQPQWTMRKFGYLFELRVGNGRLLVTGFNFTGIQNGNPAVCAMFESLIKYAAGTEFAPVEEIETAALKKYLREKAMQPRIKERKMTQFWQMNDTPLESDKYWKEAEQWIAGQL